MSEKNFGHALRLPAGRGKIARLPGDVREQLNQRLLDGQSASAILPWLNDLAPVKAVLTAQFAGELVTAQNLSNWRIGGYQHWLRDQKELSQIKKFGDHAAGMSSTYHHNLAAGTLTVASARIFQSLQSTMDEPLSATDICKIARAAVSLQGK
ncbi:MAG TPA: hypothetical protein VNU95_07425 [Candidatus Acidoferrales bacterium]|nr:hypothetical protein [Candidatus Acidoferrales bacterium]